MYGEKAFFSAELVQADSEVIAKDYYVANGRLQKCVESIRILTET